MKSFLTFFLFVFSSLSISQTTIYLVRHAEKITAKDVKNPGLTQIGQFRARNIANQLSSIGISHIYSTDYNRTMQTAQPIASLLNLEIESYDPSKLQEFADKIRQNKGNILVVGHSNTTPQLTEILSGTKIDDITENEFSNLYQVIIHGEQTILNRFKTIPASPTIPSRSK